MNNGQVEVSIEETEDGLLLNALDSTKLNHAHKTIVLDLNYENKDNITFTKVNSIDLNTIISLNLSHCNLNSFPDAFANLKLKRLNLSHNKFTDVPNCLNIGLRSLENLDLSFNQLKSFDNEPKCVIKLRVLRINNNSLINIPQWILEVNCFNLEELYYSNNETNSFKKSRFDRANSYRLKILELKNCMVRPEDINVLKNIRTLTDLVLSNDNNKMKNCFVNDDSFTNLFENPLWEDRLTKLALNNLQISFLPEEIGKLVVLEELYLAKNDLMWLPDSLSSMERLRVLDISHNQIVSLPTTVNKLKSLEILLASHNSISRAPDFTCTNLRVLDLYNNYLDIECDIKINNINEIDLEQNFFSTCYLNGQDYEEKKNFLRISMDDTRLNGPKDIHYDKESSGTCNTSTDSEWDVDDNHEEDTNEGGFKDTFDEEESWSPKRGIHDNGCTSSDNEWMGNETVYVRKKIQRPLEIPDWMFEDD